MRTILNIPLGGHEEAGRSRVIAATILQCCVFADYVEKHGDVVFG